MRWGKKFEKEFLAGVTHHAVNLLKPYPDGFFKIFQISTHERKDFLMVGNSHTDEGAAQSVGIDFLKVDEEKVQWQNI